MNYKDLIDRLRATGLQSAAEAADVIESLTAQLAAGPVAYLYHNPGGPGRASCTPPDEMKWRYGNTPLYHIPIPTEE